LSDLLRHVEVQEHAKHVWFEGLDEIPKSGKIIAFGGSIPIEKAMLNQGSGAPLLVDAMNGAPLSPDHGYPLRTVVPGYIGARSVKWLGKIVVSDRPSPNHYLATAYKIVRKTDAIDWSEAGPIYRYPVNAVICTPAANDRIGGGLVDVMGYALPTGSPGAHIHRVFVSADPKNGWSRAELVGEPREFCWQLWKARVKVTARTKQLLVRANDTAGQFMPYRVPWNAKGYLQNSWFRLPVQVDA
jgi:sulfite oxidase